MKTRKCFSWVLEGSLEVLVLDFCRVVGRTINHKRTIVRPMRRKPTGSVVLRAKREIDVPHQKVFDSCLGVFGFLRSRGGQKSKGHARQGNRTTEQRNGTNNRRKEQRPGAPSMRQIVLRIAHIVFLVSCLPSSENLGKPLRRGGVRNRYT